VRIADDSAPKRARPSGSICVLVADDHDSDVVEGLAATSLMLLENTRLVQELRESRTRILRAGERERRRLERDLHDGAQAQLVAIQIRLELARELTSRPQIIEQIEAAQHDLETSLEELRDLAHGIYPAALRDLGAAGALHSLATSSSVPVEVIDEGIGRFSDATEAAIYFCAREAIQNTAKHGGPDAKAIVNLKRGQDRIELTISDNGTGLAPGTSTDGMGITGMRDRIESVGGQFDVASAPGAGPACGPRSPTARDNVLPPCSQDSCCLRHPGGVNPLELAGLHHWRPHGNLRSCATRRGVIRAASSNDEMQLEHEPIDVRRQRLGVAIRELAADLVEERRRRSRLEREVRELRSRLASYETEDARRSTKCQPLT